MAVAYEENYYLGQIDKLSTKKVWVTFLTEKNGVFSWPRKKDRAQIAPKFIFCRNLEVVNNTKNKTYEVKNLKELQTKFQAFSRKYFK